VAKASRRSLTHLIERIVTDCDSAHDILVVAVPHAGLPSESTMANVARQVEQEQTNDELPPVIWVTPEEGRRIFDEAARTWTGMSGDEFIRRWEAGEYWEIADKPGHRHIGRLIMMMPLARQNP
jgi:hypothetical protein